MSLKLKLRNLLIEEVLLFVSLEKALPRSLYPRMLPVSTLCGVYRTAANLFRGSGACGDSDLVSAILSFSAGVSKSNELPSVEANFGVFIASLPALRPLYFVLTPMKRYSYTQKETRSHRFKSTHKSAHKYTGDGRNTFEGSGCVDPPICYVDPLTLRDGLSVLTLQVT